MYGENADEDAESIVSDYYDQENEQDFKTCPILLQYRANLDYQKTS